MGKSAGKKEKLVAEIGVVTKRPEDTTHIVLQKESTNSDLKFLAERLGIPLDKLQAERLKAEKNAREAEQQKRREKKTKARLAQEAKLEKEFLDNYGGKDGHYLLTIDGKRIHKLTDFSEIVCPTCGELLPAIRGFCQEAVEMGRFTYPINYNPLSAHEGGFLRRDEAKCKNGHKIKVIVQCIL